MRLPSPRGPLSEVVLAGLADGDVRPALPVVSRADAEDRALSLWTVHQLSYRDLDGVSADLEWDPEVVRLRRELERALEDDLRATYQPPSGVDFVEEFLDWVDEQDGVSVSAYVHRHATREQVLELLRVKSLYHLMEADPTAWLVPRLGVRATAALMELQYDEYGDGDPNRLHQHLFVRGMQASGLDATFGRYVDEAPLEVLEQNNAMTLFGQHRRLRGAALGHLAAFEATSSLPSRRMAQGLERLEFPAEMVAYYAEHVEADAVHEQLAVRTIVGGLLADEPDLAADLERDAWFGAVTCLGLEDRAGRWLLDRWEAQAAEDAQDHRDAQDVA